MAINFPDSPSVNDTHTVGNRTWKWDGTVWNLVLTTAAYTSLVDADGDTKIQVEESPDEDVIRIDVAGTEYVTIDNTGLVYVAQNAEIDGTLTANHIHGNLAGALYLHVKNTSGSTIAAGSPVYATGSVGASGATEIAASDASSASTMPALGIVQTELAPNDTGHATILGVIGGLDTSLYALNDSIYVAPGGGLTKNRPTSPSDLVQKIARVVRVDASTGELLVLGAGRTNDVPNEISIPGDLTVDTTALHVDSTNNLVGIGTNTPSAQLTVQASSTGSDDGTVEFHKWLGTASSPSESEDWPVPVLALRSWDNFNFMNMLSFGYPEDAVYQTGGNVWSFRLNGISGATASSSSTNLQMVGPGTFDIDSDVDIADTLQVGGNYVSPYTGRKNYIFNGAMQVAQRGTSVSTAGGYTLDRWRIEPVNENYTAGITGNIQQVTDSGYAMSVRSAGTAPGFYMIEQRFEGRDVAHLAGRTVTFSFKVKRVSTTITQGTIRVNHDDDLTGSLRDEATIATVESNVSTISTSAYEQYSTSYTFPSTVSTGGYYRIGIYFHGMAAAPANGEMFRIKDVQLEEGNVRTPMEYRSYSEELALCQRYFQQSPRLLLPTTSGGFSNSYAGTITFATTMRTTPTMTIYNSYNYGGTVGKFNYYVNGTGYAQTPAFEALSEYGFQNVYYGYASYSLMVGSWKADAEL